MTAKLTPDEMQRWLDREPSNVCACGHGVGMHWHRPEPEGCDHSGCDCLAFMPRKAWLDWFRFEGFTQPAEYLGQRSARTGPDPVACVQKCGCEQCCDASRKSTLASKDGPNFDERPIDRVPGGAVSSSLETEEIDGEPKP